jgi:hypothetical protein
MISKIIYCAVFCIALIISNPSLALGKLGHQVVCQLAFEQLSYVKQNKITTLLNAIPKQHQSLINRYNYKKENQVITFAQACTWADAIKRLEEFKEYNAWHYMNVSRSHKKINANDCEQDCLPQAILKHQKILSQNNAGSQWNQTQALLFLSHWLGDIHQPLHISFSDDSGGNKVKFSHFETKCSNLHRYWDDCILYKGKNAKTKWLEILRSQLNQTTQPSWKPEHVWQWADESFQIIKSPNFNYCQMNSQGSCEKPSGKIRLPSNYLVLHQPIMEQQLLRAAQRLTNLLEAIL